MTTILSAVRNISKIRSWSNHRLVGSTLFKRNSTRRTTKLTSTTGPMLRDVIELKQAALWHGGKIRIDQACEAAAEGMVRQPKAPRISFRSEETRPLSGTHQEHTKSPQTSHSASCVSSSSAVELPQMSGGTCREQSSTDASDSSMCGGNCASRPESQYLFFPVFFSFQSELKLDNPVSRRRT